MDAFAPEFAQYWLASRELAPSDRWVPGDDSLSQSQQEALDELCERVSAARTIY
jgi:hypothetical protein